MPDRRIFTSIDEFRAAARAAGADAAQEHAHIRAGVDTEVRAPEDDSRVITFAISSPAVDRYGDTIAVEGWRLENYRKNPVVLWQHDNDSLPVARCNRIMIEADRLIAEAEFTPAGMARFNDTVFDMCRLGFLGAASVGFMPLRWEFVEDSDRFGINFLEQELLEFSVVNVPANADCLVQSRAAGIDVGPLLDWAEAALQRAGDRGRVIALADKVLGAEGQDARDLAWAERVAAKAGMALMSRERVESVERAAKAQRLAEARRRRERDAELIRIKRASGA